MKTRIKYATEIVNLTDVPIYMYEEDSGDIRMFMPTDVSDVLYSTKAESEDVTYFVVDSLVKLLMLLRCGKRLSRIAVVDRKDIGRDGKMITYLVAADEDNVFVRLCKRESWFGRTNHAY